MQKSSRENPPTGNPYSFEEIKRELDKIPEALKNAKSLANFKGIDETKLSYFEERETARIAKAIKYLKVMDEVKL